MTSLLLYFDLPLLVLIFGHHQQDWNKFLLNFFKKIVKPGKIAWRMNSTMGHICVLVCVSVICVLVCLCNLCACVCLIYVLVCVFHSYFLYLDQFGKFDSNYLLLVVTWNSGLNTIFIYLFFLGQKIYPITSATKQFPILRCITGFQD